MEILEIMEKRHSVRQYKDMPIEADKREVLDELCARLNAEAGLNMQIIYDEPKCFDSFMAHYGKFENVANYIALVGKKSPELDEKSGYCGEQLVLKAQELGLHTCWVALTHGKTKAVIGKGEKLVCLISLGYGRNRGVKHKNKELSAVCNFSNDMSDELKLGMQAALLAPTAMNQQKFYFEKQSDGSIKAKCGSGFYTKLDLGIVKYHFEAASGIKLAD